MFTVLWLAFFFQGMSVGFWTPALTNILRANGMGEWVAMAFMVPPLCALVSPLLGGALADQRVAAERLLGWSSLIGALLLAAAFGCLQAGGHPVWFLVLLGLYSLAHGPTWGVLTMVSLTHLSHGERSFPLVRVGATLGWVVAGVLTSYVLRADVSPLAGYAAAAARLAACGVAFFLPHTPPMGRAAGWRSRLGLEAFTLLKHRDQAVFFAVTVLYSVPLAAFYMNAPEFLRVLGDSKPTGTMAVAQVLEVVSMLVLSAVMVRFRVKVVLLWALGLSVLRFAMSAYAGLTSTIGWHIGGLALHGVCYTFYFITAQVFLDRRVDAGMRGQAQGLLGMMTSGVGPLLGALICGWLRNQCVTPDGRGWALFWGLLAAMIAVCWGIFAAGYRGRQGTTGNS